MGSHWPYQVSTSTFTGEIIYEVINKKENKKEKSEKHKNRVFCSKCLLRLGVLGVLFCSLCWFLPAILS